jgi:hypothetical protein
MLVMYSVRVTCDDALNPSSKGTCIYVLAVSCFDCTAPVCCVAGSAVYTV